MLKTHKQPGSTEHLWQDSRHQTSNIDNMDVFLIILDSFFFSQWRETDAWKSTIPLTLFYTSMEEWYELCPRNAYFSWLAVEEAQTTSSYVDLWCLKWHEMIHIRKPQVEKTELMITCQNLGLSDPLGAVCSYTTKAIIMCFLMGIPLLVCMSFIFLSWRDSGQVQLLCATSALWLSSYFQPKAPKEGQHSHHQA